MNLNDIDRRTLLTLARQSIDAGLAALRWTAMPPAGLSQPLLATRGSFITLRIDKQLRGCCGNLAADRSLGEDVWRNAWASAFSDPRFPPLETAEWPDVHIHISVLSQLEPLDILTEQELLDVLRPNIDGLVLERDQERATFLPEVWEHIFDRREFVRHLKEKAGWPGDSWSSEIKVHRYTTESFGEREEEPQITAMASQWA